MEKKFFKIFQFTSLLFFWAKSHLSQKYKRPLICSFKITGKCNLKCIHCPFWREEQKRELGFNQIIDILKKLQKNGVKIIVFEGGEPLLWRDKNLGKDINDVIKLARKMFFFTCITTNGTIDYKSSEADIVFVSIDGLKETHDTIRGKSFEKILANISCAKKSKKIVANICISKINSGDIKNLIKFLNDKIYGFTIQFYYPFENTEGTMLENSIKRNVLNKILALKKEGYKILNSYACLNKMAGNKWKCHDFLVCSVEKDGILSQGCYLKNKVLKPLCKNCGFSIHCEVSLACMLNPSAIFSAAELFWK